MKQKQHIEGVLCKQSNQVKEDYRIHLTGIVDCIRFLLAQGLAFRGNDESLSSRNKGNFLELMNFLVDHNEDMYRVWKNCRRNLKLTSPKIQKDIVKAAARATTQVILDDLGDNLFSILIDESRDVSVKEQMVVALRYVNKKGQVIERFLGVVHVSNTSAVTLKSALEELFAKYGLSLSRIRGQGYDGASNMRASCKRRDVLRESQAKNMKKALQDGEISSGRGLNQETTIKKAGETRWSSHYGTLLSITSLFSSMVEVLEMVEEDGTDADQKGLTHELSQALQRSDQDIVNAMKLVKVTKERLQAIRDNGWDSLLNDVLLFCEHNEVDIPNMDDFFKPVQKKSKRRMEKVSNLHHFQVQLFYEVIDRQIQELNNRFTEVNTELLLCVACLSPRHSFSAFDKRKLVRLAQFYPSEFSAVELLALDCQLENYFLDLKEHSLQ
ncbi:zinc finger MYM-type protein 1-like [Trifolium medium]|uniref:Zinc finger MYM-type protein 1-like n=1 Tax=Trifolium medium TaxID=97028 RepID=A0A392M5Q5_9FABA|nr:zinc finger MYM-type protein 1-like [Trifolium medium]